MLVSYNWLQSYFKNELSSPDEIAELLTFHSFEVEDIKKEGGDTIFDIDILPNRAHDCLGHFFIAKEIAMLTGVALRDLSFSKHDLKKTGLSITIDENELCARYMGRLIENVTIGEAPNDIQKLLNTVDQKSINAAVDIANFVTLSLNQPLHVFDADKVEGGIIVRKAQEGERITTLDGNDVELSPDVLVIADEKDPLAIAGIKGGTKAEVTEDTKNLILESANFNSAHIRKTARVLGIRTDASKRFENAISPELVSLGMDYLTDLLVEHIGGKETKVHEVVDVYPEGTRSYRAGISVSDVERKLGISLSQKELEDILTKLSCEYEEVSIVETILKKAKEYVGKPYKRGASISYEAPDVFDCSSFTAYVYSHAGIQLPRISIDQYVFIDAKEGVEPKRGDIVFFNTGQGKIFHESIEFIPGTEVSGGVDHCGIYLGDGKIIHATEGKGVVIESLHESERFKNIIGVGHIQDGKRYVVTIPYERLDLTNPGGFITGGNTEDLIEEVGRLYGYKSITAQPLPKIHKETTVDKNIAYGQSIRAFLTEQGFSEVYTTSFVEHGERELANPSAKDRRYLRTSLSPQMRETLAFNLHNKDLLGLSEVRLFEIGTVFEKDSEHTVLCFGIAGPKKKVLEEEIESIVGALCEHLGVAKDEVTMKKDDGVVEINLSLLLEKLSERGAYEKPQEIKKVQFAAISPYPFVTRDISLWVPQDTTEDEVKDFLIDEGGILLATTQLFDRYEKDDKVSYAFRLVFLSHEKTLSHGEVNEIMTRVEEAIARKEEWMVR